MIKCIDCDTEMLPRKGDYVYDAQGLAVCLVGVDMHDCPSCGEEAVSIPRAEPLRRFLTRHPEIKRVTFNGTGWVSAETEPPTRLVITVERTTDGWVAHVPDLGVSAVANDRDRAIVLAQGRAFEVIGDRIADGTMVAEPVEFHDGEVVVPYDEIMARVMKSFARTKRRYEVTFVAAAK